MFTGLIREFGEVQSFANGILEVKAKHKPKLGDSIAINGACLTVIELNYPNFKVEISDESDAILALENYEGKVHIEPAMKLSDRLEGHIVQGHVDTVGVINSITQNSNSFDFVININKEYMKFVVPKGSITIDGVSLTVNDVYEEGFRLTIISHTMKDTLFSKYGVGSRVNVETDMFARYLHHMFGKKDALSWEDATKFTALY